MKNKKPNLKVNELLEKLTVILQRLRRYSLIIFLVVVGLVYSFVLFRIHSLSTAQPSSTAVSSQVKAAQIPQIEPSVVKQLQSLQDNSVSVQALFNQARNNPFQ